MSLRSEAMVPDQSRASAAAQEFDIVLKPVSHPELGDIRIEENLFAVGRGEPPFDSYAADVVADLSRRHARIFSEYGGAYVADLGSKNGTTVNGASVRQKIVRIETGDDICFAGALSYRVQLRPRAQPRREAKLAGLTLTPEHKEAGLQPILITRFPFLISKTDDAFARYKESSPQQVNYLSRRHAHVFVKGEQAYIEDLGSTNGTFVGGKRLDEHAVKLHDGDVLAFGGNHFVYRVGLVQDESAIDPTVTKLSAAAHPGHPTQAAAESEKTTFVAAADSFLDIFCVDQAQQHEDEINKEAQQEPPEAGDVHGKARGRLGALLHELIGAFSEGRAGERKQMRRPAIIAAATLGVVVLAFYFHGLPERRVKNFMDEGDYSRAAIVASRYLEGDSGNAELRALDTEALLKASIPVWWSMVKARRFDQAGGAIAEMKKLSAHNADVQPLVAELEWIGNLESFVAARGGADKTIQTPADEARIKALLKQWDDDRDRHQSAFAAIAAYAPEFRDAYAESLSHLRKLELASTSTNTSTGDNHEQRASTPTSDGSVGGP
jgi:pSer/pThr/pTyr-binding forkhead associated (FHA) protein